MKELFVLDTCILFFKNVLIIVTKWKPYLCALWHGPLSTEDPLNIYLDVFLFDKAVEFPIMFYVKIVSHTSKKVSVFNIKVYYNRLISTVIL